MTLFLLKRLATLAATLLATSIVVFVVLEILPGDAAQMMMGPDASPEAVAALRAKLGLDRPALERYFAWIAGMATAELGTSHAYGAPVAGLIAERLALTVPLAVLAMTLTAVLALAAGLYAASRHGRLGDVGLMGLTQVGIAIPNFWFAILLILLFAVQLRWFSAGGFPGWDAGVGPALKSLVLPAVSLAVVQAAILARITRPAVLDVLRNAMIPVLTVMGLQFATLLAGTIVVETVFYLPGLGRLIFQSISNRDLIVVRNCVMLLAAMVVVVNFVVDVLYAAIDPRLKPADA